MAKDEIGLEKIKQIEKTVANYAHDVKEAMDNVYKSIKTVPEDIQKTQKDFSASREKVLKTMKAFGVDTNAFMKSISTEAEKTGKAQSDLMLKWINRQEEYITDELSMLQARKKKMELDWRGQSNLLKRMSGLGKSMWTDYKKKSPFISTLSTMKDFIVGNKEAMLQNQKDILTNNKEMLSITRKREKVEEDNLKVESEADKKQYILEKQRALATKRMAAWKKEQIKIDGQRIIDPEAARMKKAEIWNDILDDKTYKKSLGKRFDEKNRVETTAKIQSPEQKAAVSNNKEFKKMSKSLENIEHTKSGGLGSFLMMLLGPLLLGGGLAMLFKLLGSKNIINNVLGSFKIMDKIKDLKFISKIPMMTKAIELSFGMIGKLGKLIEGVGGMFGKSIGKVAGKLIGKNLAKSIGKKIPGVGLLMGMILAAKRWKEGDWGGALMELASGGFSLIPGVGTAISVALDIILAAKDLGSGSQNVNMGITDINKIRKLGDTGDTKTSSPEAYMNIPALSGLIKKPKLANGGIVTRSTNAIIGEAGPEAIIPLKKYTPMALANESLNKIMDKNKKNEDLLEILKTFLKTEFADALAKKMVQNNKSNNTNVTAFSGFSFDWGK